MSRFSILTPPPVVDYRFGDIYYITDFVQPKNPMVLSEFSKLDAPDTDMFVENVARWIHLDSEIAYPSDDKGFPTAEGQLLRYRQSSRRWHFNSRRYYVWSFPAEVLTLRKAIDHASSNLVTSILRVKPVEAWTCLGLIRQVTGDILGHHAWTRVKYY